MGPNHEPLIEKDAPMPPQTESRVNQITASPMPPPGPMVETLMARMVEMFSFASSIETTRPEMKVTSHGWVLKNSRCIRMEARRSSGFLWILRSAGDKPCLWVAHKDADAGTGDDRAVDVGQDVEEVDPRDAREDSNHERLDKGDVR